MAYPTTLALITALWSGQPRTHVHRARGRRSAAGSPRSGPLIAGWLLGHFWWGSVFLATLPLAAVALVMAIRFVPAHVNEATDPVDNLGGMLSIVMVAGAGAGHQLRARSRPRARRDRSRGHRRRGADRLRDPPAPGPLPALRPRHRESAHLLGRRARRHHRVRLAHGRDVRRPAVPAERARRTRRSKSGAAILPAVVFMVLAAPRSAKLIETHGARFTLLCGYVFCLLGFLTMLLLWEDGSAYWQVGLGYAFIGLGVGLAGTPGLALADRVGAGAARRDGVGDRRPPTRPRRGDHAVDPRRAAHRRVRGRVRQADRGFAERQRRQHQRARRSSRSRSRARRTPPTQYPQYAKQIISRREDVVRRRRQLGLHRGDRRDRPRRGARVLHVPEARRRGGAPRRVPRRGHRSGAQSPRPGDLPTRELR